MYSPQKRHFQYVLFRLRAHNYVYLIINYNTFQIRRTQSRLSLVGFRTFRTFDQFRGFDQTLH